MLVGEMDMVALCAYINTGHGTGQCILDQKSRYKLSHGTHQEFQCAERHLLYCHGNMCGLYYLLSLCFT